MQHPLVANLLLFAADRVGHGAEERIEIRDGWVLRVSSDLELVAIRALSRQEREINGIQVLDVPDPRKFFVDRELPHGKWEIRRTEVNEWLTS